MVNGQKCPYFTHSLTLKIYETLFVPFEKVIVPFYTVIVPFEKVIVAFYNVIVPFELDIDFS